MTQERDEPAAMALERFQAILDAYGADADAWPRDERPAALALAAQSERAQRLLDEAAALDELLAEAPSVEPSAALRQRVLESAPERRRSWLDAFDRWSASLWPFTPRWQPATVLAAAAVLGVLIGVSSPDGAGGTEPVEIAELAFDLDVDDEGYDWSELP